MSPLRPIAAALIAGLLASGATLPALAAAPAPQLRATVSPEISPVLEYVRARAADSAGLTELAAVGYGAALAASPDDELIATRAYRQAMMAGDRALAVRAARILDAKDRLPPDGEMLLLVEAVAARDWDGADALADRIEKDQVFAFTVPVLRAWIVRGRGKGDPLEPLDGARRAGGIAAAYAAEHRALLLIATGQRDEGVAAVKSLTGPGGRGALRLRIAAAAALVKAGDRAQALALLDGEEPLLAVARRRIAERKPLPPGVSTAPEGLAELFTRVAVDINRERVTPIALTFARLGTFMAPKHAETWLVASELLTAQEHYGTALKILDNIGSRDPMAEAARGQRMELLVKLGDRETALDEALKTARRSTEPAAWTRVGGIYSQLDRPADAADAYRRAIDLAGSGDGAGPRWTLLLLLGSSLHEAGDWAAARPVLEEAAKAAPDEAVVLNYLGYAQLERRENLAEAQTLIERASELRPDDSAITDSLGWTHYVRGDVPRAIELLERAVEGEPGEPTINEHLGDAYWSAGRRLEARFAWRAALVHADDKEKQRISAKIDMGWTPEMAAP
ncbi:tetratricopeptide repeat protein [Edaphosphingomonas haloaromaticamans]|uniref:Tetratricopeptide repeat protein n=1 Tax=Edaphosphingomonas haloaromaticamans TaxID=653954 RepID=A0A1S1HBC9_9SPHN|nr:tetratricopeptide repeat protein [Sphingomonas haloaromaticamans]OHT19539.1 Tetratricopeptide repeat protein [Sphingomonas haloaromaticamans]